MNCATVSGGCFSSPIYLTHCCFRVLDMLGTTHELKTGMHILILADKLTVLKITGAKFVMFRCKSRRTKTCLESIIYSTNKMTKHSSWRPGDLANPYSLKSPLRNRIYFHSVFESDSIQLYQKYKEVLVRHNIYKITFIPVF